jgi:exodeoxyribonuclease X
MFPNGTSRIRVLDLETTGTTASDHVVEMAAVDVIGDGIELVGAMLIKPPCAIPPGASAIHHIVDADVTDCEPFEACWPRLLDVDGAAGVSGFASHNWAFDGQWLADKLGGRSAACTYKAALRLWPEAPNHGNQTLRYWMRPVGLDRTKADAAHRAAADAYVTAHLLRELLRNVSFEQLVEWTAEPACLPTIPFGKHRGSKWADVPEDYLRWVVEKSDGTTDVKYWAKRELHARAAARVEAYRRWSTARNNPDLSPLGDR